MTSMQIEIAPSKPEHATRLLTPQEIMMVAGGPEGSVGSGMSPPCVVQPGLRLLSQQEIMTVAGGPECEVGAGLG